MSSRQRLNDAIRPVLEMLERRDLFAVPHADPGGPYSINEGSTQIITGTASTGGSLTYQWDLNYDGVTFHPIFSTPSFSFKPSDGGTTRHMALKVTNVDGTETTAFDVTVNDVAPTINVSGSGTGTEGNSYAITWTKSDPGQDTITSWRVDWGDGGAVQVLAANATGANHSFATAGNYTVVVSAVDEDGTHAASNHSVTITHVLPVVTASGDPTVNEGADYTVDFSATDAGGTAVALWAVDWGDGSSDVFDGSASSATHAFDDNGAYVVTATAVSEDGDSGSDTVNVTVNNVAPTPTISGAPGGSIGEGTTVTLGATRSDPGVNDTVSYAWAVTKNGSAFDSGSGSSFSFTPTDNGAYVATLTATDNDGDHSSVSTSTITVTNVNPVATISGAPMGHVNEGTAVTLAGSATDDGSADTLSYAWAVTKNGSDYTIGTGTSFVFTPNDNGAYIVTMTASDDDNGSNADAKTITVDNVAPDNAAISGAPASGNEGTAITLGASSTDVGSGDSVTYSWAVTKDAAPYTTGNGVSFSFTPDDDGSYVVTMTATDDDGDTDADTATITGLNVDPAHVTITGAPTSSAEGTAITVTASATDAGSADSVTYGWVVTKDSAPFDTGAGSIYVFTPDDNGSYEVTLTATDDDGGDASTARTVTVTNVAPTPTITGAPGTITEGTAVTLAATRTDPGSNDTVSYAWSVTKNGSAFTTDTGAGLTFTPTDNGTYVATVTATDNNSGAASISTGSIVVTNVAPVASIGNAPGGHVNEGTAVTLTGNITDDGSADTHTYAWVVLKNGAPFTTGTGASYSFTPNDNGTYEVTVTATDDDGGTDTDMVAIDADNVAPDTAAIAGAPANSNEGTPITLTASSHDVGSGDSVTYSWSVTKGGGAYVTGTGTSFTFTPNDNAAYVVTLTATDDDGDTDTDTANITGDNVAPANVTITGNPASWPEGAEINLSGSATDAGSADVVSYDWTVTKGGNSFATGTGTTFDFTPDDNASYVVTFTATDDDGDDTSTTATIAVTNVVPTPTITGTPGTISEGATVSLTASATDAGTDDTFSYAWAVTKNGSAYTTGAGTVFTFVPTDNGTYVATLTATDNDGGHADIASSSIVVVNVDPTVSIGGAPGGHVNEGSGVTLTGTPTDAGSSDTHTYAWNVTKNGSAYVTGTGAVYNFTPNDNGVYVVTVTASDDDGGTGTDAVTITADNVAPTGAAISGAPANSNEGTPITLGATASDVGTGDTISYAWTVTKDGGGYTTGTGSSFVLTPDDNGSYVVTMVASDDDGDTSTDTATIAVANVAPGSVTITGAPTSSAEGTALTLTGSAVDVGTADTITYSWTVTKDGGAYDTGTGATYAFTPDDNGSYVVTMTATDDDTDANSASKTITVTNVAPTPTITGAPGTITEGTAVTLAATRTDPGSLDTVSYAWSVTKNGSAFTTDTGAGLTFTPTDNGTYVATVTATDNNSGAASISTGSIIVTNVNPTATLSGAPGGHINEGTAVTLSGSATDAGADDTHTFSWNVTKGGDPYATGTGTNYVFTPTDNGTYVVTVTAADDDGGTGPDSTTITVDNVAPANVIIAGAPANSDEGTAVTLTASATDVGSADVVTYAWVVTKGGAPYATGNGTTFSFTPDDNESYEVTLTASDDDGDSDTDTATIAVANVDPTNATISGAPSSSAEGTAITLSGTADDAGSADTLTYSWSVTKDGGAFSTGTGSTFNFTPDDNGSYVVNITATDDDGGFDTDVKTIAVTNVAPTPTITGVPGTITEGTAVTLAATRTDPGSLDTVSYAWSVTKNGSAYTTGAGSSFSFTPTDNGNYVATVTATDNNAGHDSVSTGTIVVTNVAPVATITTTPGGNVNEGSAVTIGGTATDAGSSDTLSYTWLVTRDGDQYATGSGSSFVFTPDDNASYVVTMTATDDDGDTDTDTTTVVVDNVDPNSTAIAGVLGSNPEGTAITLSGSANDAGSADTISYSWVVTKGSSQYATGTGSSFSFTPDDNATYVVTLTSTDDDSGTDTDSATIAVTNVDPTASITGAPTTSPEGTAITLGVSPADVGSLDTFTYSWSVTKNSVSYGSAGTNSSYNFTPNDNGTYVVSVTVTDKDGGAVTDAKTITVQNVAPAATISSTISDPTYEGSTLSFSSAISDAGSLDNSFTYSWSVTKGSQSFTLPGSVVTTNSSFAFVPTDNGNYVVHLAVTDKDGDTGTSDTDPIAVSNAAPVVNISGEPSGTAYEGGTITIIGDATDAGPLDTLTYHWTVTRNDSVYALDESVATNGANLVFAPNNQGNYVVTLKVTDKDGTFTTESSSTITVTNAAPTATITGMPDSPTNEGTSISLGVLASDAGVNDSVTYLWSVLRNGETYNLPGGADVTGNGFTFLPTDNGAYVVTVRVTDNDGAFVDSTPVTINVQNADPVGSLSGNTTGLEGSEVTLTANGTDAGDDTLTYAWTVTRGLTTFDSGTGKNISFVPDDNGTYVVTVTVSDGDGGSDEMTQNVVVSNVVPIGSITGTLTGRVEGSEISLTAGGTDQSSVDLEEGLDFAWTVTKGDASVASGSGEDITFTPADNGTYTITLVTTDKDDATHSTTATIVVTNANPVAAITGVPDETTEGSVVELGSEVTDAGELDTLTYAWSVRKGGQLVNLGLGAVTDEADFSFTPADNGTYSVRLVVTDKDGGTITTEEEVIVSNVDPTASVDGPEEVLRGTVAHFDGSFDDDGILDSHTITWSFGDGATQVFAGSNASATSINHTYNTPGTYTVTYTVTDKDGGSVTAEMEITISAAMVDTDPNDSDKTALFINGTNGADNIVLRPGDGGTIEVLMNGESQGFFTFDGGIYINAYAGDDNINISNDIATGAVIDAGTGNDNVNAGAGDDTIIAGAGDDTVRGGDGDDSITGGSGADRLIGSDGNDNIDGGTENDVIYGLTGNDLLKGGAGKDRLYGAEGDDNLNGGDGEDTITGDAGKDRINGDAGNDNLDGGAGADQINGGNGADQLIGGAGADRLNGDAGNDTMNGGADADRLDGGEGKDSALKDVLDKYSNTESVVKSLTKPKGAKKK